MPFRWPPGPIPLAELAGQPFLAPRQATSCAEMIQRACARAGFVPRVVARASDFQVLLSLVAAGAGVTLVPGLAARWLPPRVRLVPPADPVTRRVFTVSRRGGDRKPAVRVVLDALSGSGPPGRPGPAGHGMAVAAARGADPGRPYPAGRTRAARAGRRLRLAPGRRDRRLRRAGFEAVAMLRSRVRDLRTHVVLASRRSSSSPSTTACAARG